MEIMLCIDVGRPTGLDWRNWPLTQSTSSTDMTILTIFRNLLYVWFRILNFLGLQSFDSI